MKEKGLLSKALSYITYKESSKQEKFSLPEINEAGDVTGINLTDEDLEKKEADTQGSTHSNNAALDPNGEQFEKTGRKFEQNSPISNKIEDNIQFIQKQFNFPDNTDIMIRELVIENEHKVFLAYLDGMVARDTLNNFIIRPLLNNVKLERITDKCSFEDIAYNVIEVNQLKKVTQSDIVISEILSGNTAIYINNCNYYIVCETRGYEKRPVDKPQVESVVKGSQEAFNENLRTNITLVRKILRTRDLTAEMIHIGDRNNNQCSILYIKSLANSTLVDEVRRRLKGIRTDFVLGDGYLEQYLEENPWSIFPAILSTERPDRTASHILEGKIAIMAEGTPFALIVPVTLFTLMHSPEDTALRWQYGFALRLIRMFAIFVASMLPGLYVALTYFHREMIPTDLLIAIAKARENVPFPTIFEVILMEASFELIREAGIRIPGIIGNTIGIIGALILGQAAVQANLVSPVLIIIVAFTGLGNFAIPDFSVAFGVRLMRIAYIIAGAMLGFVGISLIMIVSAALLSSKKSFGVPFLSSLAPTIRKSHDSLIRFPLWKQEFRPDNVNPKDVRRQPDISRQWMNEKPVNTKADFTNSKEGDNQKKV
jgi:spore germination protein KA